MSILRRIQRILVAFDPRTNNVDNQGSQGEFHTLDDSLNSFYIEQIQNQHCGCFAPAGGRCAVCGKISCIRCHSLCGGTDNPASSGCGAPLCREHAHYLQLSDGRAIPFCRHCCGKLVRKGRWLMTGRLLLSPFSRRKYYE